MQEINPLEDLKYKETERLKSTRYHLEAAWNLIQALKIAQNQHIKKNEEISTYTEEIQKSKYDYCSLILPEKMIQASIFYAQKNNPQAEFLSTKVNYNTIVNPGIIEILTQSKKQNLTKLRQKTKEEQIKSLQDQINKLLKNN